MSFKILIQLIKFIILISLKIKFLLNLNAQNMKINNRITYIILIIYYFLGVCIYKDFGLGIEEHFQRKLGFYWLNYF